MTFILWTQCCPSFQIDLIIQLKSFAADFSTKCIPLRKTLSLSLPLEGLQFRDNMESLLHMEALLHLTQINAQTNLK